MVNKTKKQKFFQKKYTPWLLILILILETIGFCLSMSMTRWKIFIYYTELSNLLTALSVVALLINYKKNKISHLTVLARYISSCMLLLTALVTIFVLVPTGEQSVGQLLLSPLEVGFYHHLTCPILSIFSYIALEPHIKPKKQILAPFFITTLYGMILLLLNIFHVLNGPYPFLRVYNQTVSASVIWFVSVLTGTLALSWIVAFLSKKRDSIQK